MDEPVKSGESARMRQYAALAQAEVLRHALKAIHDLPEGATLREATLILASAQIDAICGTYLPPVPGQSGN